MLADQIIELVREGAPEAVKSRDRNDICLGLAFARALRCIRSIRDIAAVHGEADDAFALTRALVVLCVQAAWLVKPDDPDERLRRSRVLELAARRQLRTQACAMEGLGMDFGMAATDFDDRIHDLEDMSIEKTPTDESMALEVGMKHFYARIYRSASDVAHYSLWSALSGFDLTGVEGDIESLDGLPIRFLDGGPPGSSRAARQRPYA